MARSFPGTNGNFLSIANPIGALDIAAPPMTLVCWVKVTTFANDKYLMSRDSFNVGDGGWSFSTASSTGQKFKFQLINDSRGAKNVLTSTAFVTGQWYHLAVVVDGTGANGLHIYQDGSLEADATSQTMDDSSSDFVLGAQNNGGGNPLTGSLAEVAVWASALSAAEIAALAKGVSPLRFRPTLLRAYYPLWGVGAAVEPDLSGNSQPLTETGTVGVVDHAPVGPYVLL